MKTFLLIVSIIVIAACVLALLFALLNLMGYRTLLDGSHEQYEAMHRRMTAAFIAAAVLAAIGAACLIIRAKI